MSQESHPYQPGDPQCGNCDPYGSGFPGNPDAPTDGACIPDTTDPCAPKPVQDTPCPNAVCDPRFQNLSPSKTMRIFGAVGNCLYQFPNHSNGFVMSGPKGQFITSRPIVDIPFLKSYIQDPETGKFLRDSENRLLEDEVPKYAANIAIDECGGWNYVQGLPGKRQRQIWDGEQMCWVDDVEREENPLLDPQDVPIVDQGCPETLVAALIPTSEEVVGSCGEAETKFGFKLGGLTNVGAPIGSVVIWPGQHDNVPLGWGLCDGGEEDINDFPAAFAVLGYSWGGGGNTFRRPDMRGRHIRGVDIGVGNDPDAATRKAIHTGGNTGDNVGSLQEDAMQCFDATYDKYIHNSESVVQATVGASKNVAKDSSQYTLTNVEFIDAGCGDPRFAGDTRPSNVYVNYIIKMGCPPTIA